MTDEVPRTVERTAALLDKQALSWHRPTSGYTPADRYVVRFNDGASAFAKAATNLLTAQWLRAEYINIYSRLREPFLPRVLAWEDDAASPLLVLEDLSTAHWPPPWTDAYIRLVVETLQAVHSTALDDLPDLRDVMDPENWDVVAREPRQFLSLGLTSEAWLQQALPVLSSASGGAPLSGTHLVHLDLRSDNMCFIEDRAVLIDWNGACRGNGDLDIAAWLPSLQSEGGPAPETILPRAPELAAYVSGYFAARAGLPVIPTAPRVREVQLAQLRTALPWAQRALGLPPLDGEDVRPLC